jgi:hypothetical protein
MENQDKTLDEEDVAQLVKYFEVLAEIERSLDSTDSNSVATEV